MNMQYLKRNFPRYETRTHLEAGFRFANFTLMTGLFLVGFALANGAGNILIGVLSAIPLFANLMQFISAYILEKTGTRKKTALISLTIAHIAWIPVVFASFGVIRHPLVIITVALASYSLLTALGSLSILSWLKELVPTKSLSRVLGKRNTFAYLGGMIVYFIGSYLVDVIPGMKAYGFIFIASILLGFLAIFFVLSVPEKKKKIKAISFDNFKARWIQPFRDKKFRPLLRFGVAWGFALNISGPFFLVYLLNNLHLGFFISSIFLAVDTIGRVIGYRFWVPIADRYGSRPTLVVSATISSLVALLFFFITTNNSLLIPLLWIISGVSFSGAELSTYRALFKAAPRKNDAYYLSAFIGLSGLSTAIAPIVGGFIITGIEKYSVMGGWFEPIRYIFIITFVLRVLCIPLISSIYEREAKSVEDVLRKMKTVRFLSIFADIYGFAFYASKLVLFPQKQLFVMQRKTTIRLKKDANDMMLLLSKISHSLSELSRGNIEHYKKRVQALSRLLKTQVDLMGYIRGTMYQSIPRKILGKMDMLLNRWDRLGNRRMHKQTDALKKHVDHEVGRLEDAIMRNLK